MTIFVLMGLMPGWVQAAEIPPLVFLNDTPRPITVTRGQPVRVPMFVVGGDCTNREVELFIWRTKDDGTVSCLETDGWTDRESQDTCEAIGPIPALPRYIHFAWTALKSSTYLTDFDLYFCVDDIVNGSPEAMDSGHIFCGDQKIIIKDAATETQEPEPTQEQQQSQSNSNTTNSQQDQGQQAQEQGTKITTRYNLHAPSWGFGFTAPNEGQPTIYERASSVPADCTPSSASVSPTSLSFKVYVDSQSSKSTLYVRDNCRNYVDANATATDERLTLTKSGTGRISVSCDTSGLKVGQYSLGDIEIIDSFGKAHSIPVSVTVYDVSTNSDSTVSLLRQGSDQYINVIKARSVKYFSFKTYKGVYGIQLSNTPYPDQPHTVHLLVKRGSKPTISDFEKTWPLAPPKDGKLWNGFSWKYNTGSAGELIEITDPPEDLSDVTFYVMLYNDGDRDVKQQRISLTIYAK